MSPDKSVHCRSHSSGLSRLDEEPAERQQLPPVPLRSRSADTPLTAGAALAHAAGMQLHANVGAILAASQQQQQQQERERPAGTGQPVSLPQQELLLQMLSQIQQQQQQQQQQQHLPPNGSYPVGASLSWSTSSAPMH